MIFELTYKTNENYLKTERISCVNMYAYMKCMTFDLYVFFYTYVQGVLIAHIKYLNSI